MESWFYIPDINLFVCLPPFITTNFTVKPQTSRQARPALSITRPSAPFITTSGGRLQAEDAPIGFTIYVIEILPWGKPSSEVCFYETQMWIRAHPNLFSITRSLLSWMPGTFLIIDGWMDSLACSIDFCLYEAVKTRLIGDQWKQMSWNPKIHSNHTENTKMDCM